MKDKLAALLPRLHQQIRMLTVPRPKSSIIPDRQLRTAEIHSPAMRECLLLQLRGWACDSVPVFPVLPSWLKR